MGKGPEEGQGQAAAAVAPSTGEAVRQGGDRVSFVLEERLFPLSVHFLRENFPDPA